MKGGDAGGAHVALQSPVLSSVGQSTVDSVYWSAEVFPGDSLVYRPPGIRVIPRVLDQTVPAVIICTRQGNLRARAIGVRVAIHEASRWRGRWGGRLRR
eukprot:scaffold1013_cov74-Phaeocystis_antarctica.AAC.1